MSCEFQKDSTMRDFRTLKVWEKAHEFTLRIYRRTAVFPSDERFGLILQMRRVAAAIPMAISNAAATADDADFARQFQVAIRSSSEMEYQLILARDLGYLTADEEKEFGTAIVEVRKMLIGYSQKLRTHDS